MVRWLGILLVLILATPVDAQVFKPKGKKADVIEKKPAKKAAATKKAAPAKKKAPAKGKKNAVADRGRPDDSTPEASSKNEDADFVKITDDEDIE